MELKTYLAILAKRWRIMLLVIIVVFCAAALGNQLSSPMYRAETALRIITPVGGGLGETQYQTMFATRLMNTYVQIATSEKLGNELKEKLRLTALPDISVEIVPDSEIIKVVVESDDPKLAAVTANTLADLICSYQDPAASSGISDEVSRWANRVEELKEQLAQDQVEHARLAQAYAEKMAEVTILERTIQLKEMSYQDLAAQHAESLVSNVTSKGTKDPLLQEMDRIGQEIEALNPQYKQLLTDSSNYLQQLTLIRETIGNTRNAYAEILYRYDIVLTSTYRQDTAQNIRILSPASTPAQPAGPSRGLVLAVELIIAIMLGIASAFVLENLNYSQVTKPALKPA